jgi:DNA-binding transcriptional regulator/RsmH inhibitor MraZ
MPQGIIYSYVVFCNRLCYYLDMKTFLHIEVTEEFRDILLAQAKKEYTTLSALIRKIAREYVGDAQNSTVWSRHKKKMTTLEKEIAGVGAFDKLKERTDDEEFEQSLRESL